MQELIISPVMETPHSNLCKATKISIHAFEGLLGVFQDAFPQTLLCSPCLLGKMHLMCLLAKVKQDRL